MTLKGALGSYTIPELALLASLGMLNTFVHLICRIMPSELGKSLCALLNRNYHQKPPTSKVRSWLGGAPLGYLGCRGSHLRHGRQPPLFPVGTLVVPHPSPSSPLAIGT